MSYHGFGLWQYNPHHLGCGKTLLQVCCQIVIGIIVVISVLLDIVVRSGKLKKKKEHKGEMNKEDKGEVKA